MQAESPQYVCFRLSYWAKTLLNDSFGSENDPTSGIRAQEEEFLQKQPLFLTSTPSFQNWTRFNGQNDLNFIYYMRNSVLKNPWKNWTLIQLKIGKKIVISFENDFGLSDVSTISYEITCLELISYEINPLFRTK